MKGDLPKDLQDALLGFDPRRITCFLMGGKPKPAVLQRLKRKGLCRRFYRLARATHYWELTLEGERVLKEVRLNRGLPEYPLDWHRMD